MPRWIVNLKRLVFEPIVHFMIAGGLMFAAYAVLDRDYVTRPEIVRVTAAEVGWLADIWARQWRRPPDETELRGIVLDYLRETLLAREARAVAGRIEPQQRMEQPNPRPAARRLAPLVHRRLAVPARCAASRARSRS